MGAGQSLLSWFEVVFQFWCCQCVREMIEGDPDLLLSAVAGGHRALVARCWSYQVS